MQKLILIPLVLILVASVVHAQNVTAGISPDNPLLWRVELFFEHASAAITYDDAEKVEKRLHSAEERAAEMEKMLRFKKTESAQTAKDAFDNELMAIETYLSELQYKNPQNELEAEYTLQGILDTYTGELNAIKEKLDTDELDDAQKQLVTNFSERVHATNFQEALNAKKNATILKLKANGLSDTDIAALESGTLAKLKSLAGSLLNETQKKLFNETEVQQPVEQPQQINPELVQTTQSVVSPPVSAPEVSQPVVSTPPVQSIVTDTSSSSKLKIDGTVTANQEDAINELYNQLVAESTEAEIEITVTQMDNGMWRIEKEIDGTLTQTQDQQLDDLLVSLGNAPSSLHITIRYDPTSPGADAYSGSNENVSTSFVIG